VPGSATADAPDSLAAAQPVDRVRPCPVDPGAACGPVTPAGNEA
jgi:hypothetical protein